MISLHTSPLDQPGTGDAGGMNVYVVELSAPAGRQRHRGRHLHPRHLLRAAAGRRGPDRRRAGAPRRGRPVRGAHQGRAARPAVHLRPRGAARRGRPPAGPLRRGPLPLLALRPGRRARPRPLGGAAGALDAHHGQGQERRARRGRHPRARRPADRRGAGRRGRRHARSPTPTSRPSSSSTCTTPTRRASRSSTPASTSTSSAPGPGGGPPARSACPPTRVVLMFAGRIQPLKAPDVLLRAVAVLLDQDPRCARASSYPSSADRPAAGSSTPSRSPSSRPSSASTTWSASCRRSPRTSWPAGAPRRRWSPCRRTTSPSGWSPARPRPPARRWWRPPWAA